MELHELFIIALSLSMDAFAVSVCKGLSAGRPRLRHCLACGVWFGGFQALMPLIGWLLGVRFQGMILSVDHWIAFFLLSVIGFNMARESRGSGAEELDCSFRPWAMLPLAIATSIDALAVGVTFAFLQADICSAVALIGGTTFFLSAAGTKAGVFFGARLKSQAELAGGLVLMGMGVKILAEHTLFA